MMRPRPRKTSRIRRPKMVTVARDCRNSGRDYQLPAFQAKQLYDMGYLAWSPDTKTYIDDDGRIYNALRQGRLVVPGIALPNNGGKS